MFYTEIIKTLKKETDSVILFHSATGKDSICLCDLLSKNFENVLCVFMYIVKGLEYENRYIEWAKKTYGNITFFQTPHYATYSFVEHSYLGIQKADIGKMKISIMTELIRDKFQLEWAVFGFKKNDGITRRFMLKDYSKGIDFKTKKCFPVMDLKNSDILNYISDHSLIQPFCYNKAKPSSGCDISDPTFLSYIKTKYPEDLKKIYEVYPFCEAILFRYENYGKN